VWDDVKKTQWTCDECGRTVVLEHTDHRKPPDKWIQRDHGYYVGGYPRDICPECQVKEKS
jgi:rubrerythrin